MATNLDQEWGGRAGSGEGERRETGLRPSSRPRHRTALQRESALRPGPDRRGSRAFDLEAAGRLRDALAAWRQVIATGAVGQGVLGLERVFSQLAQDDSGLPTLDSLLVQSPADRILRGVQLRVLRSLGREREAHVAFDEWVRLAPHDPVPYREYAGDLLRDGRADAADTVLQQAS